MSLDRATVNRIRGNQDAYRMAKAAGKETPLQIEVMQARLGELFIRHADDILRILEAHV